MLDVVVKATGGPGLIQGSIITIFPKVSLLNAIVQYLLSNPLSKPKMPERKYKEWIKLCLYLSKMTVN